MKKFLFTTCLLLLVIGLSGCGTDKPSVLKKDPGAEQEMDFKSVCRFGDHSYIPLNISGRPSDHVETILNVIKSFEEKHPDLKTKDWKIEKTQDSKTTSDQIHGIWIDQEPR